MRDPHALRGWRTEPSGGERGAGRHPLSPSLPVPLAGRSRRRLGPTVTPPAFGVGGPSVGSAFSCVTVTVGKLWGPPCPLPRHRVIDAQGGGVAAGSAGGRVPRASQGQRSGHVCQHRSRRYDSRPWTEPRRRRALGPERTRSHPNPGGDREWPQGGSRGSRLYADPSGLPRQERVCLYLAEQQVFCNEPGRWREGEGPASLRKLPTLGALGPMTRKQAPMEEPSLSEKPRLGGTACFSHCPWGVL